MALLLDSPSPALERTTAAMRVIAGEMMETTARTREIILRSQEAMAKADRILGWQREP